MELKQEISRWQAVLSRGIMTPIALLDTNFSILPANYKITTLHFITLVMTTWVYVSVESTNAQAGIASTYDAGVVSGNLNDEKVMIISE